MAETLGAAASALAFVTLALKSAKSIYETLSAIKDGPEIVSKVSNEVLQLQGILERLQRGRISHDNNDALKIQLDIFSQNLASMAGDVKKLQVSPHERSHGRLWKRLKTFLNEEKLRSIYPQITQQTSSLSLHVSANTNDTAMLTYQTAGSLGTSINQHYETYTTQLQNLETSVNESAREFKNFLENLNRKIESQTSFPESQSRRIDDIAQQVMSVLSAEYKPKPASRADSPRVGSEIPRSIERLCMLLNEKGKTIDTHFDDDEQAEEIIEDMQDLLKWAKSSSTKLTESSDEPHKNTEELEKAFKSSTSRFGRSFGGTTLAINSFQASKAPAYTPGTYAVQIQSSYTSENHIGTLTLHKKKRKWYERNQSHQDESGQKRPRVDYDMKIQFLPKAQQQGLHMLVATFRTREFFERAMSSISRLEVSRLLPEGSHVFDVVRNGFVDELKRMIQDGEASIRDHDEYGASLLHYSSQQPEMCKFLIENGLDVDHVADAYGFHGHHFQFSPLQMEVNDAERTHGERLRINHCRRLLLEAGADPTVKDTNLHSLPGAVVSNGSTESIRLVLNSEMVKLLVNIKEFRYGKDSLLHTFCYYSTIFTEEAISEILRHGVDVQERDSQGRTYLHAVMENTNRFCQEYWGTEVSWVGMTGAIRLLIKAGVDVHSVDWHGRSVSCVAYTGYGWAGRAWDPSSCVGDLWDAALSSCGYNISDFRSGHPRIAQYSESYTRADFESMWKGRETECPYWDDQTWPADDAAVENPEEGCPYWDLRWAGTDSWSDENDPRDRFIYEVMVLKDEVSECRSLYFETEGEESESDEEQEDEMQREVEEVAETDSEFSEIESESDEEDGGVPLKI